MTALKSPTLALLLALATAPALAAGPAAAHAQAHADAELAALAKAKANDPFTEVYILTSRRTYTSGLQLIGRNPAPRRDSTGNDLVLARIQAHQLTDVSEFVHEKERRCGGYFAFDSLAEADAFLRADRAQSAQATSFLASYTIDNQATVNPWLPQVSEPTIRNTISWLSTNYVNRYYGSTPGHAAPTWIRDQWLSLANGRSDVSAELFTSCGNCGGQASVILTIQGTDLPNEIVVLGGHLDSISSTGTGDSMNAPGADDDASGIASLTEVLRIAMASGWKPKRTIKFMGYAAEEVGLRGSAAIASSFRSQGKNVVGVLQLDMTDYRSGSPYDMQLISDYSNSALQQFVRNLFDTYLAPLGMSRGSYTCGYGCSDHASWTSNGFPSAMMYEGGDWPYLHTPNDNLAKLGNTATPSVALVKLGLAFLGELGKTGSGNPPPPPPSGGALSNGVAVTNLSAAAGGTLNFTLSVPAGASNLKFAQGGGTGNADLYVRFGSAPTDTTYDCRPYRAGNLESCSFAAPQAGTWYVRIKARTAFSGVRLTPSFAASGGGSGGSGGVQTYSNSTATAIPDGGQVDSAITVSGRSGNASGTSQVSVNISHAKRGDLRLRLVAPDGSSYLLKAANGTDTAPNLVATYTVNLSTEVLNGTWKLRVIDTTAGNTGTLNTWSITF
jgi:leucyl aminopeptidase